MHAFLEALAQAVAVTATADLGKLLLGGVAALFSALSAALWWAIRTIVKSVMSEAAGVRSDVAQLKQDVQKVSGILTGPDGRNGVRGDVRRMRRSVIGHDRALVRVCERMGIDTHDLSLPTEDDDE
jgi:membrane protein implicated in regulation of membrane protease activity